MQNDTKDAKKRSMFVVVAQWLGFHFSLLFILTPILMKIESVPTPDSTTIKKSKTASSAEEDNNEVYTLQVSTVCSHSKALQNLSNSLFGALLQIRGRKRYEMLKKINDGLDLLEK